MRAISHGHSLSRREFLKRGGTAAGILGLGLVSSRAAESQSNAFAYDISRFSKTDPKLLLYEQVRVFPAPRSEPRRIAVGPDQRLYVANGKYLSVLDAKGALLSEIALADAARAVALSADAEIFVGLRDHVEVYDRKGQARARWDVPGPRAWITSLAVTRDSVFVADAGNRVVLRCDRSGKVLGRIGEKNKIRNIPGFIVPSPYFDLEMHRDGLLRVTNPGRHRVEAYTVDGDFEVAWGKPSAAIDGFCGCCNPINIALFNDGRIITCEKGLPRVKIYSAEGVFEGVVAGPEFFPENVKASAGDGLSDGVHGGVDAAVNQAGEVFILDLVKGDVRVMAPKAGSARPAAKTTKNPA